MKVDDVVLPPLLKRRLMSRVSIFSLSHRSSEATRLPLKEPLIKNGVRLEFQFSRQIASQPASLDQQSSLSKLIFEDFLLFPSRSIRSVTSNESQRR